MVELVNPNSSLGYSRLYLDQVSGNSEALHFYAGQSLEEVADSLDGINYPRDAVADLLETQNRSYGCSQATFDNIDKLRDSGTLCVFSGQQAGLFGGPMLVIFKALAIVKACRKYAKTLNRPVVPMFWIAADDHDFAEVNHTFILDHGSEVCRVSYDGVRDLELPMGETSLSDVDALDRARQQLREELGDSDFTDDLYSLIDRCYTTEDTFVSAFAKLMTALVGEYGLVLFSPSDPKAKQLAVPLFEQILHKQDELHGQLNAANREIVDSGYHLQVEKKPEAVHLFLNREGRRPILRDGDMFVAGEERFILDELLQLIRSEPERFSPDVMTKPVFQSYLFPVLSQKGGPAEIAYLAQMNRLFPLFDRVAPYYRARATATIVEKRFQKIMTAHDISLEDLAGDVEQVVNRVLGVSFPSDLEQKSQTMKTDVDETVGSFVDMALKFEPSLETYSNQVRGKIDHLLRQMEGKLFAAHKRRSAQVRDSIYRLWRVLYPHRALQERTLNMSYFLSRYGRGIIPFLFEQLDSEETSHQLIHLSDLKEAP
ncbi:MAG: bacillithiol biosynthesis cysteine-adding enzyme BshC [candidate division Zixibacteria bacterium]|nr:bacillithiol biosynthesis cysteine-adding enzyme BshC [candidate division Zixibacteria bacterium]